MVRILSGGQNLQILRRYVIIVYEEYEYSSGAKGGNQMEGVNTIMPAEKFAELMNVSLAYLSKYNARVIQKAEKEKGLLVRKEGRGKAARYIVEPLSKKEKEIEKSLFEYEEQQIVIEKEWVSYEAMKFKLLLLLTLKPEGTFFEGTLDDIMNSIDIRDNKKDTRSKLQAAIKALHDEEVIIAYYDKKQKKTQTWILFIRPSAKENIVPINTDGIVHIKKLCDANSISVKWENFLKVWLALKVFRMDGKENFTYQQIQDMTALGRNTIMKVLTYMAENGILTISRDIKFVKETKSFVNMGNKATHHNFDFDLI